MCCTQTYALSLDKLVHAGTLCVSGLVVPARKVDHLDDDKLAVGALAHLLDHSIVDVLDLLQILKKAENHRAAFSCGKTTYVHIVLVDRAQPYDNQR